jgi:hypothetical protein
MRQKRIFLGCFTLAFLLASLAPVAAQSSIGGGSYSLLREAWLDSDISLNMSRKSLENQELQFALANASLGTGWQLGLGSGQGSGMEIREGSASDSLFWNIAPSASVAFGEDQQTNAGLSARISQDGRGPVSIAPQISLAHQISDLSGADEFDPGELADFISLLESRVSHAQQEIASEIDLFGQLNELWSAILEIEDQEYQLDELEDERRDAVQIFSYPEGGSYVTNLDYQLEVLRRQLNYGRLVLEQDLAYFVDNTGISLDAMLLEQALREISDAADEITPQYPEGLPGFDEFASYRFAMLNRELAESRLGDDLESDQADLSLGVSAGGALTDGNLDSSDISGSIGVNIGSRISGSLTLGYQSGSGPAAGDSPYASLSLSFSESGRDEIDALELETLRIQLERAELSLRLSMETAQLQAQAYENQLAQAADRLANLESQLEALGVERDELLLSLERGVASEENLADLDHQIRQAEGKRISAVIDGLIIRKQIQSATIDVASME